MHDIINFYLNTESLYTATQDAGSNGEKGQYIQWSEYGSPRMSAIAFDIYDN